MSGFAHHPAGRRLRRLALCLAALAGIGAGLPALAEAPKRVVSMNLCTDQLAMLLADAGQLVSVTYLAHDPRASAMVEKARDFPINHGLAEEIFLLNPDLVLAGSYTTRVTVAMLRRLGIPVVEFEPDYSFADLRANMLKMGAALGRTAQAQALVADFDSGLAALHDEIAHRPRAALYYANGYTSGDRSLAGQILAAAGFDNIAAEAGLSDGGILALELLLLSDPDFVVTGQRYPAASRAEEILSHPALRALSEDLPGGSLADRDWVCGTPHVLRAVANLRDARHAMESTE